MKLEHIEIQTADLGNTKEFYHRIFNFPVIAKDSDSISFQIGSSSLKFVEKKGEDSIYHFAFNIPENKINEALKWCKEKRLKLIPVSDGNFIADFDSWHAHSVYFFDNQGNILEFIARHDLKNSQELPFGSNQLLNISEIGIVKDNPLEYGRKLANEYGLEFFAKQHSNEFFTVLGDDEGLLIIVKNQRKWYLTQIPANSSKTEISVLNDDRIVEIKVD